MLCFFWGFFFLRGLPGRLFLKGGGGFFPGPPRKNYNGFFFSSAASSPPPPRIKFLVWFWVGFRPWGPGGPPLFLLFGFFFFSPPPPFRGLSPGSFFVEFFSLGGFEFVPPKKEKLTFLFPPRVVGGGGGGGTGLRFIFSFGHSRGGAGARGVGVWCNRRFSPGGGRGWAVSAGGAPLLLGRFLKKPPGFSFFSFSLPPPPGRVGGCWLCLVLAPGGGGAGAPPPLFPQWRDPPKGPGGEYRREHGETL